MKCSILALTLVVGASGCSPGDLTSGEHVLGQGTALLATEFQLDLTAGTTGTVFFNQSFNGENRGVDVTVLGAANLVVDTMILREFNITNSSPVSVGARIYDSPGGSLLASANATVGPGFGQSVAIPISATLIAGNRYRITFFVPTGPFGNSGDIFDPDPSNVVGFSYTEPNGLLRMGDSAWDTAADAFPTIWNTSVPMITVVASLAETTAVQLGKTAGFWSNKNGIAILDHNPKNGLVDDSVPPDSLGGSPGRLFYVGQIIESNKILKNNACTSGIPAIFNCAAPPTGQGLSKGLKVATLNTLAAQTLALYYNIRLIAGYAPQTILTLSTPTNNCAALVTSPLVGLGLGPDSAVTAVLSRANLLIQSSVAASLGGTTTQAQAGAMNRLLGCLNRDTL